MSLLLRNDGVLFQLGGQSFTPATLPPTAIPPIQPKSAILTNVDSLPTLKDQHGSYEGYYGGMALAIASTPEVNRALFTWFPDSSDPTKSQPTPVSGLSEVKEIFLGASCYYCPSYFVITNTGTIFGLDGNNNATQLSGLSDVKLITADPSRYVALTNTGTVFYGNWNSSNNQYDPAIQIANLTNVTDIKYLNNVTYALAGGKVYGWTWVLDPATSTYLPTIVTAVKDAAGNELSQVKDLRWKNQTLAVTQAGTVVWWKWNEDNKVPTVALPITGLPNVAEIVGRYSSYLARTLTGDLYYWVWKESSNAPTSASQITLPSTSKVKTLFIPGGSSDFAVLNNKEVYSWYWDSSTSGNPSMPTQIQGSSNPKEIYYYYYPYYGYSYLSLTEGKEVYRINGNATLIPGLSNVKTIAIGSHQLFLQEDGILCGTGNNSGGQLGINAPNYISYDEPLCGIEDLIVEPNTVLTSLTVNKTGTGEGTVTADTGTIYCGTSCSGNYPQKQTVTLRAKPQIGSIFTGWSDNCTNTDSIIDPVTQVGKTKVTLTNAVTCTATFDQAPLRKLTVKKEGTGNGTVTVEPSPESGNLNCGSSTCTVNYKNLTEVTLTATPDADSQDTAEINCNNQDFILTKDRECTVTFTKLLANYPLNVSITSEDGSGGKVVSEPAGIDCNSDSCTKDFPNGTAVTLTPFPNPGSIVKEWYCGGYYNSASPATVTVKGRPAYCSISFRLPPIPSNIEVDPPSHKFKFEGVNNRLTQDFSISNTSVTNLRIDSIAVKGASDFRALEDNCSNTSKATNENCKISVAYEPHTDVTQTATLWISSDDPETPLTIPFCAGAYGSTTQETEVSPTNLDFGTEVVGNSSTQTQWIKTWTDGCGALIDQNKFKLNGTNATDFNIILKECYYAAWDDKTDKPNKTTYSTCQVNVKFLPTTLEGAKNAQLDYALNDPSLPTSSVPLAGVAVATSSAQPKLEVSASSLNFGEVTLYRSSPQSTLTIKNTGNVNLIPSIKLTDSDAADFSVIGGECTSQRVLFPGNSCNLSVQFVPQGTVGNKQASLIIAPDKSYATTVTLTGNSIEATDCAEANITIESSGSGYYWDSDDTNNAAWKRLPNLTSSAPPTDKDVVRIKSGHTFFGSANPNTVVKTLCIESGATLQSIDNQGTSLTIRATDFIGNWGTILGQDGANETEPCPTRTALGTGSCAKRGASVILKVSTADSGGPIVNEGTIKAGKGGSGSQYAAAGGDAIVLGRNVLNKNIIQAGDGGDISGTLEGESGPGGLTQVLGNFGGKGYLRSETSTQIAAGNGGYCNSSATEPQMGGKGGDLRLMTIPDVYIGGGNHRAGKSSYNCAKNRGDGRVGIEPSVISLAGANTKVEGGDIFIYGGPDWTLDLSNLSGTVVTATGNITLAVGEGGVIDLRGSSGKLFNAVGQVSLFADNILLDENQKLSDLIEASQIVVGPHKILRDVALTGATRVVGEPNTTTSLILTLANGSPVNDTFSLTVTDPGSWISSTLPATLDVAGLEVANLTLPVTLPAEIGMTDTITVTATSQADPTVTATINIQVEVVDLTLLIANPSSPPIEVVEPEIPTIEVVEPEIPSPPTVLPFTIEPVSVSSGCPTTGVIDFFCSNQGQILQDATLTSSASITGGTLAGMLTNQGLVSQVTIQAGATLTGGKLTGHIINEGTLENFEFVGAVIEGGTLAGTITNRSQSEGTIKNVNLAPNTKISRVNLQGNIVGDNNAPALLEHVTIKSNTFLSGVKLGEGVIVEANVTCGEGVQAPEGVCFPGEMELPPLPDLDATATNEQGESVPSNAAFYGGISVNNGAIEAQATPTLADEVTIQGQIQVDPAHVGQAGDVVVYVDYTPVGANEPIYVMLNEAGKPVDWDGNLSNLVPFKVIPKLAELIEVLMYQNKLPVMGMLNIGFGYRLAEDGLVIHNLKPIEVNINK
ncbi:receptor protein kinase-like protein [Thioploca ingrica]|uniref:Receptor protein kinase-like protein n=1 Tax=Thioploca ingrica TaxID=40754 RepID=A0A090AJZ1_9GAMM|nr:receptor protein kinase-like protein [Thioploca ingrica]